MVTVGPNATHPMMMLLVAGCSIRLAYTLEWLATFTMVMVASISYRPAM